MRTLFCFALLLCLLAGIALAADPTGKWTAQMPGRDGQTMTQTFTFKVDGDKLTGSVTNPRGETQISDGKVNGDEISFAVVRETPNGAMKMLYTGKVGADEIKFTMKMEGRDFSREFTAKKQ